MCTTDLNWNMAPEGADKLMQDLNEIYWGNAKGEWFDTDDMTWNKPLSKNHVTIATRPQPRKTVEDAVEWVNNGNEICGRLFTQNKMLSFCKANNTYAFVSEVSSAGSVETENWQPVCTRKEFEACVAARREITMNDLNESIETGEPEWTHLYDGLKVKWLADRPDSSDEMAIQYESGDFGLAHIGAMTPIKPTITKSEAWDRVQVAGLTPQEVKERFTVK